jgi:flavin-dependent dehydrogenase
MTEITNQKIYDVVIIGGGPAGSATAIRLMQLGISSVLIVEKGSYSISRVGESLVPNTNVLLRQLGIWDDFNTEGHLPVNGSCSIWGSAEPGFNDFFINPQGTGWHLDRNRFDRFLADQACKFGAELRTETQFDKSKPNPTTHGFTLQISDKDRQIEHIETRFVVDASGVQAVFARKMVPTKKILDRLIFVSGFIEIPESVPLSSLTFLEAVEYGWWYLASLPGQRVIAALATDPEVVSEYQLSKPDNWKALLSSVQLLPDSLRPHLQPFEKLLVSPALSSYLEEPCGDNWLVVGDAASSYDPLCSLGIYKSLLTGMEAAKSIANELNNSENNLSHYKSFLQADFLKYQKARNYFYELENRWPNSPFWNRRKEAVQPSFE